MKMFFCSKKLESQSELSISIRTDLVLHYPSQKAITIVQVKNEITTDTHAYP